MDNKVKITLVTTGVLLVLIIAYGLYATFNPEIIVKEKGQESNKQQIQANQRVRAKIGEKSKLDIRSNDYYFPAKKIRKERVDPKGYLVEEAEKDDFFEDEDNQPLDMTYEFDDDYVQAPEEDDLMPEDRDDVLE